MGWGLGTSSFGYEVARLVSETPLGFYVSLVDRMLLNLKIGMLTSQFLKCVIPVYPVRRVLPQLAMFVYYLAPKIEFYLKNNTSCRKLTKL